MNLPVYTTDTLYLEKCHAEAVLYGMVHTLLFHRMIYRTVRPKEVTCSVYDSFHYVMIDDARLHEKVVEKVNAALESLRERPSGTLSILFYRVKSEGGWFSKEERVDMERWSIPLQWYELYDRSHTQAGKEQQIRKMYTTLLALLSSAPPPLYHVINDYLPFDIVDMDKPNSLKEIFQFIVSGPPKMGGLFS